MISFCTRYTIKINKPHINEKAKGLSPCTQKWGTPHCFPWQPPSTLWYWGDLIYGVPGQSIWLINQNNEKDLSIWFSNLQNVKAHIQQYWTIKISMGDTLISRNLQYSSQKKNFLFIFLTATWGQKNRIKLGWICLCKIALPYNPN